MKKLPYFGSPFAGKDGSVGGKNPLRKALKKYAPAVYNAVGVYETGDPQFGSYASDMDRPRKKKRK